MKPTGGLVGALVENGYLTLPNVKEINKMAYNALMNPQPRIEETIIETYEPLSPIQEEKKETHVHLTININTDINKESAQIISDNLKQLVSFK